MALIQGGFYLSSKSASIPGAWIGLCALGLAAGAALAGRFSDAHRRRARGPGRAGRGFSVLPAPIPNLFDAKLSLIFAGIMTVAIVFLGPGAFSLDARLFGRREIIIPQAASERP